MNPKEKFQNDLRKTLLLWITVSTELGKAHNIPAEEGIPIIIKVLKEAHEVAASYPMPSVN